jgi:hypothetical protein
VHTRFGCDGLVPQQQQRVKPLDHLSGRAGDSSRGVGLVRVSLSTAAAVGLTVNGKVDHVWEVCSAEELL